MESAVSGPLSEHLMPGTKNMAGSVIPPSDEVTISVSPATVLENGMDDLVFTLTRNASGTAVTVLFSVGGDATYNTDYTQSGATTFDASSGSVFFDVGVLSIDIHIDPTGDADIENDETVVLTIIHGTGYTPGNPDSATGNIQNDEMDFGDAPDPTYPTLLASNGARHLLTPTGIYIGYNVDPDPDGIPSIGANGDDADGTDDENGISFLSPIVLNQSADIEVYSSASGYIFGWIDFTGDGDWDDMGEELFPGGAPLVPGFNNLSFPAPAVGMPGLTYGRFRVTSVTPMTYDGLAPDGEVEDFPINVYNTQFSIDDPVVMEGNAGSTLLVFNVSRNTNGGNCSVDFAITGGTASVADGDILDLSGTVNFTAGGSLSEMVNVVVYGDLKVELDETVVMTLSLPVNGGILDGEGTGTIQNDDNAVISVTSPGLTEGNTGSTGLTFDIAMSHVSDAAVSFNFGTVNGSATTVNNDYIAATGTHTLMPGQLMKTVTVQVNGDCAIEPNEYFLLQLSNLSANGRSVAFSGNGANLNGTGNITNDDELPGLTCMPDLNDNTDPGQCSAVVTIPLPTTSSICGTSTLQFRRRTVSPTNVPTGPWSGLIPAASNTQTFAAGRHEIEWQLTDGSGTSTCHHYLDVVDNEDPVALCKNATLNLAANGTATLTAAMIDNGSHDNCSVSLSLSLSSFNCTHVGSNLVTLTATDPANNSHTCQATVQVQDNLPPTASCKNAAVTLDVNGNAILTAAQVNNNSTDNCGIAGLSVLPNAFTCANLGTNSVTLTVMDVNGQSATCTATVTVSDNLPPVPVCGNITLNLDPTGYGSITAAQVFQGGSDNCGAVNPVSVTPHQFDCGDIGPNTVTLTANDGNGNTGTCQSTVTVAPFITVNQVISVNPYCGVPNGSITILATTLGGQLNYSIDGGSTWQFQSTFSGLAAGTYNLKVRANGTSGCSVTIGNVTLTASNDPATWYKDADNDGYSDGTTQAACSQPSGYKLAVFLIATSGDCNDGNANIHPGAPEICGNAVDENCDGNISEGTVTWTGLGDGLLWTDPANWDNSLVPHLCNDIVIPAGYTVQVSAGVSATGKSLLVDQNAVLTVDPTAVMLIEN